jgi:type II secretory pathway component GspD/PulD (secretin)
VKTLILAAIFTITASFAIAQTNESTTVTVDNTVTVQSNGNDVRTVLYDLFSQAQKSFVSDVGMYYSLYLTLNNVSFDQALDMICKTAGLSYRIENGVYIFSRTKIGAEQRSERLTIKPLDPAVLNKTLTLKAEQTELKAVLEEIGKKVGVTIEVAPNVKPYKINAYLVDSSLRFALNSITQSAKLMYVFTDYGTIKVADPESQIAGSVQTTTQNQVAAEPCCEKCFAGLSKEWKFCPKCGHPAKSD